MCGSVGGRRAGGHVTGGTETCKGGCQSLAPLLGTLYHLHLDRRMHCLQSVAWAGFPRDRDPQKLRTAGSPLLRTPTLACNNLTSKQAALLRWHGMKQTTYPWVHAPLCCGSSTAVVAI